MWSKLTNRASSLEETAPVLEVRTPPPPPAPLPRTQPGGLIGSAMRIKGEIYCREALAIDGEVEGTLESTDRLTVGANGKVTAHIKAGEVDVRGSICGDVEATERIVIRRGANIVGDVKTAGIVIEDGAFFKGGIDITRKEQAKAASPSS